jgi:hypothetical protein
MTWPASSIYPVQEVEAVVAADSALMVAAACGQMGEADSGQTAD